MAEPGGFIMVIEDSPEDFEAIERSFVKAGVTQLVRHHADGEQALDYLHRRGDFASGTDAPRPGLILLDLNLPGIDGLEILSDLKSDPTLRSIPVVVLTTSDDPRDVRDCYGAGANTFIQKPLSLDGLLEMTRGLRDYWLGLAVLPGGDR